MTPRFGRGVQVKRGNTTAVGETNFTLIPGFMGTLSMGGAADKKDISTHDDTASRLRSYGSGMVDPGSLDGDLLFDPDDVTQAAVLADWLAGTFRDYQIVLPTGITRKFGARACVANFKMSFPLDDYVKCSVSFAFLTVNFNA